MPPNDKFEEYLKFKLMNFAKNLVRSEWRIFRIGVGKDSRGLSEFISPSVPPFPIKWLSHGFIASIKTNSREYGRNSADLYVEKQVG